MAHYTTTIKALLDNGFDLGLQDYPIWNESYRNILNKKILDHYYVDEIGYETAELFKHFLNARMNEIMPYYNELYLNQEKLLTDNLENVDLYESSSRSNTSETSSESSSNSNTKNLFQDTPQGQLDFTNLENQKWATNFTMNKGDVSDTSSSNGENQEEYTRHLHGNNGKDYKYKLLLDIKNNLYNIDMRIIDDLKELFMQIY